MKCCFSLVCMLIIQLFLDCNGLNINSTNGFTFEQIKHWNSIYEKWIKTGLRRSNEILNCSNIDRHDPIHDKEKTRLDFPSDECSRTFLRGMCGSLGRPKDLIPHPHICDGNIREFGNYR